MFPPSGFDVEKHDRYVAQGNCNYVENKTYCNAKANHSGEHWAFYYLPGGKVRRVILSDAVVYERPAEPEISGGDARRGDSSYHGSSPQG